MSRGWPQGCPPGDDIWPDGAGGGPYTKNDERKWKLNFQVVQIFLQLITGRVGVRVKGWEELLGAWGLRMYPQMTKNDQKWQNSINAMLKPHYEAILLHKNLYNTISLPRMNVIPCLGVC